MEGRKGNKMEGRKGNKKGAMVMYNQNDVRKARADKRTWQPEERELELVNTLADIRYMNMSGSYEMGVVDEILYKLGYTPNKEGGPRKGDGQEIN